MSTPMLGRLLIVDDEVWFKEAVCQFLQDQGYETVGFSASTEALETLKGENFDLLLTDLVMPKMDGIELLRAGLEIDPYLVGVIMTSQGRVQTVVEAMRVGAFDYVLKPFELETLLPTLSRAMEVRRLRLANVQLREALTIYELCKGIVLTFDQDTLLRKAADGALQQCEADDVSIMLPTQDNDQLYVAALSGKHPRPILGVRVPIEQGIAGWVARHQEPLTLHGEIQDSRFRPINPRPEVRSAISMPMLAGRGLVGVLNVNATRRPRPFSAGQVKALTILSNTAAFALEALQLYAQVRESEEKFRSFVENTKEWIWSADLEGRMTYNNPAVKDILGYSPEELLGRNGFELMHPEERAKIIKMLPRWIAEKSGWTDLVVRWQHKDGSLRYLESDADPILNDRGELVGFRGADRDITERMQLEQQILQLQKMEAIGRLAGGVAHDFNNLLTVIMGYTDLMMEEIEPGDPLYVPLETIRTSSQRAASLTRQLLAFSRKQVLQSRVLNLNSLLADLDKMLQRLIGENITLVSRLARDLGHVRADPGQIEQVIMNLVVNARDAMPQGGKLTLETANIELDEAYARRQVGVQPGSYLMLAVTDTGSGMDAETQSHIFEPFFTTKEPSKGTGLGLSTVYGIVKQSGGHIWVDSEPGRGAIFKVYLPRVEIVTPSEEIGQPTSVSVRGTETILVLEDGDDLRNLARGILHSNGYNVLEARSGTEALEICEKYPAPVHLMVIDVVLPDLSGSELAEQLARLRPDSKILFMSGHTDDTIIRHGVLDSYTAFLSMPFTADTLARKVREVLDQPGRV